MRSEHAGAIVMARPGTAIGTGIGPSRARSAWPRGPRARLDFGGQYLATTA